PGPEKGDGPRREGKSAVALAQRQIKNQIFAVIQPFGITAGRFPGLFEKGYRPAGRQEARRVYVRKRREYGSAQRHLEVGIGIWLEPAGDHGNSVFLDGPDQRFQPEGRENNAGVGGGDDRPGGGGDSAVAPCTDVAARRQHDLEGEPFLVLAQHLQRLVGGTAVGDHDLVGQAYLLEQRVEEEADRLALVFDGGDDGYLHEEASCLCQGRDRSPGTIQNRTRARL